jgi:hypothetical protein
LHRRSTAQECIPPAAAGPRASLAGTRTAQPLLPSGKPGTTLGIRQCQCHCHCPSSLSIVSVCSVLCQYQGARVFVLPRRVFVSCAPVYLCVCVPVCLCACVPVCLYSACAVSSGVTSAVTSAVSSEVTSPVSSLVSSSVSSSVSHHQATRRKGARHGGRSRCRSEGKATCYGQ